MNRRDLMKASAAAAALNVFGFRATRAAANEVYIDPNAYGTGHFGTYADPYSTADALIYFSLLSGDLQNRRIRFKTGTTFIGRVAIAGCDNYVLEPYGDNTVPVISNHVDIPNLAWTPDDGTLGGPANDVYFLPVSGGAGSNWTAGETAVIFDDGNGAQQCEYRDSYPALVGSLYPCNEAAYPGGWPFLQWWDRISEPNRMWVRGPAGWNPDSMTVVRPAGLYVMDLSSGSGVTVSDMDLQCGAAGGLLAADVSGLLLDHVDCHNIGGDTNYAQNVFNLVGNSKASRAAEITMRACRAYRSYQRGSSHGLEISWLRNVTVDDFEVRDIRLHGIEFWSSTSDVTVRRMKARQTFTLMQFQSGDPVPADTLHDNIVVQNCECVQRESYLAHSAGDIYLAGGNGIVVCDSSRNSRFVSDLRIYENSFDLDGAFFLYGYIDGSAESGLGNNAVTFKGNVCRLSQLTNTVFGGVYCCAVDAAAAEWTMDRNVFQFAANPTDKFAVAGVHTSGLADYQALWDANGAPTNEDNSIMADAAAPLYSVPGGTLQTADLSLINGSVAAAGLGDTSDGYTPATDILGVTRDDSPDAGAYEYRPEADTDGDGVADRADNCKLQSNPTQCDSDHDGYGNHCDGDLNNNGFTNAQDYVVLRGQLGTGTSGPTYNAADLNCNRYVNAQDYGLFRQLLGKPSGPSGLLP